jgi:hypothetical protein
MEKQNSIKEEQQKHTALDVIEDECVKLLTDVTEDVPISKRRGRYGATQAAQSLDARLTTAGHEAQSSSRVLISQESNHLLDELTGRINDGFEAGRVTRPQILNWILRRFAETAGEEEIQELRAAHFDRIAYLEVLLKRAKETGVLPPELNAALPSPSASAHAAKKSKRALTKNIITGDIISDDV